MTIQGQISKMTDASRPRSRSAHLSGLTVTIQNPLRLVTSNKARLVLMACLMRFVALPLAADPDQRATREAVARMQQIFVQH
ncbi:Hypothetical protein RG540_PA07330 (plasmid) [Neorhizobium galegae bv. orientalis str. HAMBI 540]|uniref:Uncharacterized protein n=2 Tax=Neorhizobium galegae TaxID=399 RepID=A0A068T002_NEOGA|nr:Hypothetical protein RG540_PA07330 [Neorhizobium galegae bv. orientalis str. HAMBI 540]